jgi:hypothetical protein
MTPELKQQAEGFLAEHPNGEKHGSWVVPSLFKSACKIIRSLLAEIRDYEKSNTVPRSRIEAIEVELRTAKDTLKEVQKNARAEIERLEKYKKIWNPSVELQPDAYGQGKQLLHAYIEERKKHIHLDLTDGGQTWQGYVPLPKDWRR